MCEKSIHHMETNKEHSVSLMEGHSCSPATGPAAASRPARGQPAVISSHLPPHRYRKGLETWAWCCTPESKTVHLRVSLTDMCQITQAKKKKKAKMLPHPPLHL